MAVSHADPIKAAVAHAMGTHLDLFQRIVVSPCSVSAVLYGVDGPVVLAVNSTGDLSALAPVMTSYDLPAPEVFTAGTVGDRRASASSTSRPATATRVVTLRCEKQQVAALAEYFDGLLDDLEPTPYGIAAGDLRLAEPFEEGWTVGPIGVAYDEPDDRIVVVLEELVDEEERRRGRVGEGPPHPGAGVGVRGPRPRAGGGRTAAVPVLRPARSTPTGTCAPA